MSEVALTVDPAFVVGTLDRRRFGSFVEHMGRSVYGGIYEPGHPCADAAGLRTDVLELVRELGVTTIRYPGGNVVSSYRWEDGAGPVGLVPAWKNHMTYGCGVWATNWTVRGGSVAKPPMNTADSPPKRPRR